MRKTAIGMIGGGVLLAAACGIDLPEGIPVSATPDASATSGSSSGLGSSSSGMLGTSTSSSGSSSGSTSSSSSSGAASTSSSSSSSSSSSGAMMDATPDVVDTGLDATTDSTSDADARPDGAADGGKPNGASCMDDSDCSPSLVCDGIVNKQCSFADSCNQLKTKRGAQHVAGRVTLRKGFLGGSYDAYCDADGWTLAMKIDGTKQTFNYDAQLWTNNTLLEAASIDLSKQEAKLESSTEVRIAEIKLAFQNTMKNVILKRSDFDTFIVPATLIQVVGAGKTRPVDAARKTEWKDAVTAMRLQDNCNQEVIARNGPNLKLRIGFVANNESNCNGPDSFVGVGASFGYGGVFAGGRYAWLENTEDPQASLHDWVYVYVK
jgi:hypothetical protein